MDKQIAKDIINKYIDECDLIEDFSLRRHVEMETQEQSKFANIELVLFTKGEQVKNKQKLKADKEDIPKITYRTSEKIPLD